MVEFFQTIMGRKFFEGTVPRIVNALEDIARELKTYNENKAKEGEV